jgi:hypothetical protein
MTKRIRLRPLRPRPEVPIEAILYSLEHRRAHFASTSVLPLVRPWLEFWYETPGDRALDAEGVWWRVAGEDWWDSYANVRVCLSAPGGAWPISNDADGCVCSPYGRDYQLPCPWATTLLAEDLDLVRLDEDEDKHEYIGLRVRDLRVSAPWGPGGGVMLRAA